MFPAAFLRVSYRQYPNMTPVSLGMWARLLEVRVDATDMAMHRTRSIYFPLLYAPQGLVMVLVLRALDAPVAVLYYVARLTSLAIYAVLVFFAIRRIPYGKWLLTILGLSPMAMTQASIVSPDAMDNGGAFVFTAWVLSLDAMQPAELTSRDFTKTLLLVVFLACLKPTTPVLLLLLLALPRDGLGSFGRRIGLAVTAALSFLVVSVGWNVVMGMTVGVNSPLPGVDSAAQLRGMVSSPLAYARVLGATLRTTLPRYLEEWVGVPGYAAWQMPSVIYILYPGLVLYVLLSEAAGPSLSPKRRALLVSTFAAAALAIGSLMYMAFNPVGAPLIAGIQGRYFIGIAPLLLMALLPTRPLLKRSTPVVVLSSAVLLSLVLTASSLAYHMACGDAWFHRGLCYLPKYKNWAPDISRTLQVSETHFAAQDFTAECGNLTQIRLWTRNQESSPDAGIEVSVLDATSREPLAVGTFKAPEVPEGGWLHLDVPVVAHSKKQSFFIYVRPLNPERPQALGVAYMTTNEYYEGRAWYDGDDLYGDLIFQYACVTGLERLLSR